MQMNHDSIFSQFLISESVRPYEYTKRNAIQMKNLLAGLDEEEIETTDVYRFLKNLEPIPLHLYLKRWLYQNCNMQGDFDSIDNHSYYQVIRQSFYKNQTPFSWEKTAKKPNAIINSWLERGSVRRKTIFLLGFGLGMTEDEVSDFLVKAIRRRTSSVKCILDHMNELLDQCHMAPVYLGSPYEIFLIICLCTDTPLDLYLDIMELSYNVKEGTI